RGSGRRGGHGRSRPATSSRGRWDVWWRRVGGAVRGVRCAAVRGRRRRGRCRSRCLLVGGGEGEGGGGAVGQVHLEAAVVGVGGPGGVPGGAVGGGVFEGGAVVVVEHARVGPATSGGGDGELLAAARIAKGGGVGVLAHVGGRGGHDPVVEALQPGGGGSGVHAATSSCSCRWRARWRWMVRVDTPSRAASDRRVGWPRSRVASSAAISCWRVGWSSSVPRSRGRSSQSAMRPRACMGPIWSQQAQAIMRGA